MLRHTQHTISLLFLLCISIYSIAQGTIPLFVGIRVALAVTHALPIDRINTTIKKKINPSYQAYNPNLYHITLANIGQIAPENLPKVYKAMDTYIQNLDQEEARKIIEEFVIDPENPLDYFPGKFNNFFVLKLIGPDKEGDATLVRPLKAIIHNTLASILQKDTAPEKEFPFHPHISLGKMKSALLPEEDVETILKKLSQSIPRTKIRVASPTIVLYKGITGGFVPLKEYALTTMVDAEQPCQVYLTHKQAKLNKTTRHRMKRSERRSIHHNDKHQHQAGHSPYYNAETIASH